MKISKTFMVNIPGQGMLIYGIPIGQTKHLFDRYRNYLAWFQLPLVLYTAVVSTIQYFPTSLAGHLPEILVASFVGFSIFSIVVMFLDLKFVFPNEREFMYNSTPYFERRFNSLDKKLDEHFKKGAD
jgi:hypothetical protein